MVAAPDRRPVLMIVHSYVAEDPRVRRQAEALVAAGRPVTILGLRPPDGPPRLDLGGIDLHQLDVQRHQGAGLGTYLREYLTFLARALVAAVRLHRRRRFALIQVHSLPDFLVFAALPLRLVGVPVLLDLHEAMPEFFRSRFPRASNPLVHRVLLLQERLSIAAATHTITVNEAMRSRLVELGARPERVGVVINSPSLARFDAAAHPTRAFREDGRLRLVYAGALTPTYELDVAVRAVAGLAASRPDLDVRFDVFGRGDSEPALRDLAASLGVADRITFHGRVPIDEVPARVAAADIGLAPTRHDPFTDMSLSTKVYEYAAMGKPVVASGLPMVERTFPSGTVAAYPPGDDAAMAAAIVRFADDAAARDAAVRDTLAIVRDSAWERQSVGYLALVERSIAGSR
ncbi:MAG: glycosyltransferase family 4 protein [Candidatus Limnocylindria bacterium]